MNFSFDEMEPYGRFRMDVEALAEEALTFGMSARMLAVNLLAISHIISKEGGPLVQFDHALWMQAEGKRLLREFEQEYGDQLDWPSLIEGKVVPKKTSLN